MKKNSNKIVNFVIFIIVLITVFVCVVPFLYIIAVSFSSNRAIVSEQVTLYPIDFTLKTYQTIFHDAAMMYSVAYSVVLTVVYTVMSMVVTVLAAYPLTKKYLKGRNFLLMFMLFCLYFSGGLIPDYILVKNLGLLNTVWSLILPGVLSIYNMIIMKSFFQSIPESLEEAAALDGCNDMGILVKIVLPLSKPALATISLFYAVTRWNSFMDALFYITNPKLYTIQLKLYTIIMESQQLDIQREGVGASLTPMALQAGSVIIAMVPILLVYPWLQKYFVSGLMIGAVKG